MIEKYFYLDESPIYRGKYLIRLRHENLLFPTGTRGSFNVFLARLCNLSYAQYLRYCRDVLGAEIVGKGHHYPIAYFEVNETTRMFVKFLNSTMNYIFNEREYPFNYREKEDGTVERTPFK